MRKIKNKMSRRIPKTPLNHICSLLTIIGLLLTVFAYYPVVKILLIFFYAMLCIALGAAATLFTLGLVWIIPELEFLKNFVKGAFELLDKMFNGTDALLPFMQQNYMLIVISCVILAIITLVLCIIDRKKYKVNHLGKGSFIRLFISIITVVLSIILLVTQIFGLSFFG